MIYEMRVYRVHPGKVSEFNAIIESVLPAITKHFTMVGAWSTEIGTLNEVTHMWAFPDFAARERAYAADRADPDLIAISDDLLSLVSSQYTRILMPSTFSPLK